MNLSLNETLQCVPNLRVEIESSTSIKIIIEGRTMRAGSHVLSILDVFSQPTNITEALKKLKSRTEAAEEWINMTSAIVRLYEAGVLQSDRRIGIKLASSPFGYDSPLIHTAMLNDAARTSSYLTAIKEVVRPGDVVVEIGSGTGVLSIGAARAGASRVYAIEVSGMAKTSRVVFAANGVQDRITLIEGWSTQISLPERADVLISEIIGSDPLGEHVVELTKDALKRFLKRDARLVPSKVEVFGLPVTIPERELVKRTFVPSGLKNWRALYGVDFSPLGDAARNAPHMFYIQPFSARRWKTLGSPVSLARLNLEEIGDVTIDNTVVSAANAKGELNGMLLYFELALSPTTSLSTHPAVASKDNSWLSPVWVFLDSLYVKAGDRFRASYRYRVPGAKKGLSLSKV